jgi:tRNA nucleotidyltransferase/poly(A) polymerase
MSSRMTPGFSLPVPPAVRWIVSTLEDEGFETWTVGGAVRDAVAGRPSGDWDLTTRAEPGEVRRIFRRTVPVGVEHGTVGVLARDGTMYEVTTFRRDVETFGRHAVVAFAETLLEDLERRDFTINAMAWHPLREELCDPHGGAQDLRDGLLRTVGRPADRFAEDYLRILRAFRFAGRYGLRVGDETWESARAAVHHLPELSPERIREELWKILGGADAPSRALELYRRSGALGVLYPELARWSGDPDGESGPGWAETLAVVDRIPPHRAALRLAALLGPVGEPPVAPDDPPIPREAGPAPGAIRVRAMVRAAALLTRLRHSNAQVADISGWVGAGPGLPGASAPDAEVRRYLARVGRERVAPLVRWSAARARAGVPGADAPGEVVAQWRRIRETLRSGAPLAVGELALNGRDLIRLGLRPGPHFGRILDRLLERVLEDPAANDRDRLSAWARTLAEGVE